MPNWVAAMLRSTLARPRTFSTGAATERGSDPRSARQSGRLGDPAVDAAQSDGFRCGQVERLAVPSSSACISATSASAT